MDYITAREAAAKWNISQRRVQKLCEQGRILGVLHFGTSWMIPKEAAKPADPRKERTQRMQPNENAVEGAPQDVYQ